MQQSKDGYIHIENRVRFDFVNIRSPTHEFYAVLKHVILAFHLRHENVRPFLMTLWSTDGEIIPSPHLRLMKRPLVTRKAPPPINSAKQTHVARRSDQSDRVSIASRRGRVAKENNQIRISAEPLPGSFTRKFATASVCCAYM